MSQLSMTDEEVAFSEIIGDLVEQWGFNRHLGRIWSLLYLRKEPVNPSDMQTALGMSAGAVSAALHELQTWGVVKRIRLAGDRSFYYEPETQIWRSVSSVLRAREVRILEEASSGIKALAQGLAKKKSKQGDAALKIKRLKHVDEALTSALLILSQVASVNPLSLAKMGQALVKLRQL